MAEKLKALFHKYYDILAYLFFGVLTTVVNYLVYLPCCNILGWSAGLSNVVAWAVAVVFAFVTNKPFVFKSHDWSASVAWPEFRNFVGCRLGSGALETAIIFIFCDCLHWDKTWMKLFTSVLVVILNYVASKLLVFKKK